jgi:CBS domain-containing protein
MVCLCNIDAVQVRDIATMGAQIIVAKKTDSVNDCMKKMLARDIRHLPVIDDVTGEVIAFIYDTCTAV